MTNSIFGESLTANHRGHAAGRNAVEKAASQLVSDVKYKVKKELGPNTNLNPAQVAQKYQQKLSASPAPPSVKAIAKKKLMGEEYTSDVKERVQNSLVDVLSKVFVEGIEEEIQNTEYELQLEEIEERKYWVVVTDKKTSNTYRRRATRAKIAELRSNPNIARVEITQYHPNEKDDEKGQKTAKVKSGKGLKNDGNLANNYPPYDKVTRGDVIAGATGRDQMGGKRKVKEEFIGEVKNIKTKKEVTGKGVNNYGGKKAVVKVFPNMQEQSQMILPDKNQKPVKDVVDPNERKQISTLQQFQRREQQLNQQKIAAQKAGKVPVGSVQMNSHEPEGEDIQEVSPAGFKGTVKAMKKHPEIDNPYALAWHMKKKGYKSHRTASGAMKEEACGCEDEKEPKLKKSEGGVEDPREIPTKINLVKNKLRAMGLKMSYEPEGEVIGEEESDRMRDREQEMAGMDRPSRYAGGRNPNKPATQTGPKKKPGDPNAAFNAVVANLKAQHGSNAVMASMRTRKGGQG